MVCRFPAAWIALWRSAWNGASYDYGGTSAKVGRSSGPLPASGRPESGLEAVRPTGLRQQVNREGSQPVAALVVLTCDRAQAIFDMLL